MKKIFVLGIFLLLIAGVVFKCLPETSSEYEKIERQHISVFGVSFDIPQNWELKYSSDDNQQYYDDDVNSFDCGFSISLDKESVMNERAELIIDNLKHEFCNVVGEKCMVADVDAVDISYKRKWSEKNFSCRILLFEIKKGLIIIEFGSSSQEAMDEFEKVLKSISVEE